MNKFLINFVLDISSLSQSEVLNLICMIFIVAKKSEVNFKYFLLCFLLGQLNVLYRTLEWNTNCSTNVGWLHNIPSNMLVHLMGGCANTVVHATTQRQK